MRHVPAPHGQCGHARELKRRIAHERSKIRRANEMAEKFHLQGSPSLEEQCRISAATALGRLEAFEEIAALLERRTRSGRTS